MEILIIAVLVLATGTVLYFINSAIDRAGAEDTVAETPVTPISEPVKKLPSTTALAKLKKAQIVELATEHGIKLRIKTKDEMIKELRSEHKKLNNPAKK
jgi:hypothetical protein